MDHTVFHPYFIEVVLVAIAIGLFVAFVFGYTAFWYLRNWLSPVRTVRARVLIRKARNWDAASWFERRDSLSVPHPGMWGKIVAAWSRLIEFLGLSNVSVTHGSDCYVTFQVGSRRLEFLVPPSAYVEADEGCDGILMYRGERFVSFTPLGKGPEPDRLEILT